MTTFDRLPDPKSKIYHIFSTSIREREFSPFKPLFLFQFSPAEPHLMRSRLDHSSRRSPYEMLGFPASLWWLSTMITPEKTHDHPWLDVTLGADVFKAVMGEKDGIQIWAGLMQHWQDENYFLMHSVENHSPTIHLTLDFADANFSNLFLAGVDLRFAWLNRTNFSGASLECSMFDCSYISATDFSKAQIVGASFLYCLHHPEHPPIGLSPELMKQYGVSVDPEIPFE